MLHIEGPDGVLYPIYDAIQDAVFTVYKDDGPKAVILDPWGCIEALGILHNPNVLHAHVGSGQDTHVIYKAGFGMGPHAAHYINPIATQRVRDEFELKGSPSTQELRLRAPTRTATLAERRSIGRKRWAETKAQRAEVAETPEAEHDAGAIARDVAVPSEDEDQQREPMQKRRKLRKGLPPPRHRRRNRSERMGVPGRPRPKIVDVPAQELHATG